MTHTLVKRWPDMVWSGRDNTRHPVLEIRAHRCIIDNSPQVGRLQVGPIPCELTVKKKFREHRTMRQKSDIKFLYLYGLWRISYSRRRVAHCTASSEPYVRFEPHTAPRAYLNNRIPTRPYKLRPALGGLFDLLYTQNLRGRPPQSTFTHAWVAFFLDKKNANTSRATGAWCGGERLHA